MFNVRRKAAKVGVATVAALSLPLFISQAASAEGTSQPGAQLQTTTGTALTGLQASTTPFIFALPTGAACSGDTATDGYHVQSYLSDSALEPDPGSFTYLGTGPSEADVYQLIDTTATSYGPVNTVASTGAINQPPNFEFNNNFNPFGSSSSSGDILYPGTFNIGIACSNPVPSGSNSATTDKYWNVSITFVANSSDPNKFEWEVTPAAQTPEVPFAIILPLSALGIGAAGVLVLRRRRRNEAPAA
jgi:hypothetical protein